MALILDTARFKYPPHWVPLSMLYEAMAYEDPTTGKPRGFLKVTASRTLQSVLFALGCSVEDAKWAALRRWVDDDVAGIIDAFVPAVDGESTRCSEDGRDVHDLVVRLCMSADPDVLASRTENPNCDNGTCVQSDAVETLLSEIEMLHLFEDVRAAVAEAAEAAEARSLCPRSSDDASTDDASTDDEGNQMYEVQKRLLVVLMVEDAIVGAAEAAGWDDGRLSSLKSCLMNESKEQFKVVRHEVEYLKDQYRALQEVNA